MMRGGQTTRTLFMTLIFFSFASTAGAIDYQAMSSPIKNVICGIFGVLYDLVVAIASVVFIAAIVQFIYNRDDPAKRKQAQGIMVHAVVGLIIAGLTKSIINSIGYVRACI